MKELSVSFSVRLSASSFLPLSVKFTFIELLTQLKNSVNFPETPYLNMLETSLKHLRNFFKHPLDFLEIPLKLFRLETKTPWL